jgi:hypothetical protein
MSNFQYSAPVPANGIALASFFVFSLIALGVSAVSSEAAQRISHHSPSFRYWLTWFAIAMILCGIAANELIVSRYFSHDGILETSTISLIRLLQLILVSSGVVLLMLRSRMGAILNRLAVGLANKNAQSTADIKIFFLSLLIPWTILLVVVESVAHLERFLWLWPLQTVILAALVTYIPWQLQAPPIVPLMASLLLIILIVGNPLLVSRVGAWYTDGWFGADPEQVRVAEYVTKHLNGKKQAAIGYQMFIWRFMAMFHAVDPRYKVGAEFDLLFRDRYRVSNTNHCAEGVSPNDEFRIIQTTFGWTDLSGKGYFEIKPDTSFVFLKQFGPYQVLQRQ